MMIMVGRIIRIRFKGPPLCISSFCDMPYLHIGADSNAQIAEGGIDIREKWK